MARLESRAIAGYFPTPPRLLSSLASLVEFEAAGKNCAYRIFDPVAGDGEAILGLRDAWRSRPGVLDQPILGCEMEQGRARALLANLSERHDSAIHADAFLLTWNDSSPGVSLLFLNPPYDSDREFGRMEHRFLARFTPAIAPGGALMFVLPIPALASCAERLASNFGEIQAWRFPEPEIQAYRQCVLIGRRSRSALASPAQVERIRDWARGAIEMPELPEKARKPLRIGRGRYELDARVAKVDLQAIRAAYRPNDGAIYGTDGGRGEMIGRRYPTAMPPLPAHLALALAAGQLNGHPIEPDDPRHPPLMLKGVYTKELVLLREKANSDGEITAVEMVEQPRLRLWALRLDTFEFFEPKAGIARTEAASIEEMTIADILAAYSRSLAQLMERQFPPLHSPFRPADAIALPVLAHDPLMAVQRHAVQALIKLFALGQKPRLLGEVGTGKTRMTLYTLAAMTPGQRPETLAELSRVGIEAADRLPTLRRALVICPPHLVGEWAAEIALVWPEALVFVLDRIADLEAAAAAADDGRPRIYLLSRERAKLGHGIRGLGGARELRAARLFGAKGDAVRRSAAGCPRCGAPIRERDAEINASERRRCEAQEKRAASPWAALAEDLALALLPAAPDDFGVQDLTAHRRILKLRAERAAAAFNPERVAGMLDRAFDLFKAHLRQPTVTEYHRPLDIVQSLARGLGMEQSAAVRIRAIAGAVRSSGAYTSDWLASAARERAKQLAEMPPPGDPLQELLGALRMMRSIGAWEHGPACGEFLFQADPSPARYPLARFIARRLSGVFDALILDEADEFKNRGSAQSKAAFRLVEMGIPTLALTGTINNGYASSLHALWWALDPRFREQFGRDSEADFARRYGLSKILVSPMEGRNPKAIKFGNQTDREQDCNLRRIAEAPGVLALFVLQWLLPSGVMVHKSALDRELPALRERPVPLRFEPEAEPLDGELAAEFSRLTSKLMQTVGEDRFTERAGQLWGAMGQLPSYLDRCTADLGAFEISYPDDGPLVVAGKMFPAEYRTPKERWLIQRLRENLAAGRRTLIFLTHTGTLLPGRLLRIIKAEVTRRAAWLDAKKVSSAKRRDWINEMIVKPGIEVMLVNPDAVRTGLNNLVHFASAIWFELDYKPTTYRQANGRLHRIGQKLEVEIDFPYLDETPQRVAFDLLAAKVSAALRVEGLDLTSALEAAGAAGEERLATEAMLSMGQAIYSRLSAA